MKDNLEQLARAKGSQQDAARPDIVSRVGDKGRLTARERIEILLDPGSFVETGAFVTASTLQTRQKQEERVSKVVASAAALAISTVAASDGRSPAPVESTRSAAAARTPRCARCATATR